jgi:hypothetical protein
MLGEDACRDLPFVHALTRCDSTSRISGIGQKSSPEENTFELKENFFITILQKLLFQKQAKRQFHAYKLLLT